MSKSFLLTGGAGFIGSHLAERLVSAGHTVSVLDDLSTGSRANLERLISGGSVHFARASVTNTLVLDRLASEADVIVHLAAAVGVDLVVEHPVQTIETNVMGTEAVLRAALRYNCRVLLASTSEVYGRGTRTRFHEEDDLLLGATSKSRWGYAASKMVDEFLGLAYVREHGLEVTCFRLFNTVGPRQIGRYGMVVPRFVAAALEGKPIRVFGNGAQSRCFCHVYDVVRAIHALAECTEAVGKVVNIGSTEEITIDELAQRVKSLTNSSSEIVHVPYDQAYAPGFEDMQRRQPDIERIGQLVGWRPELSLDDVLRDTQKFERVRLGIAAGAA